MTDIELMRRAAKIAGNTKCWMGIGCVIVKSGKVLAESWNETLDGEEYCQKFRDRDEEARGINKGCIRYELGLNQGREIEKCCSIHAEVMAIARSAKDGVTIKGAIIFITSFPCLICMRAIIASGIKKIVYMNDFYKPHHLEMLEKNGVKVGQIEL